MTKTFTLPQVSSTYGAPMGRADFNGDGHDLPITVEICSIRIDSQGYDSGGAYWGLGDPLFHAQESEGDDLDLFFRAKGRKAAEAAILKDRPNAKIEWIEETVTRAPLHVVSILYIDQLPEECIHECSGPGDNSQAVAYWRAELGFTVDRTNAVNCLRGYGYEPDRVEVFSNEQLAEHVLWLACADFSEYLRWREDNPEALDGECPCGSDIFSLEG